MASAIEVPVEQRMLQQLEKRESAQACRCPCGCTLADLDSAGLCYHFIGSTKEGDKKPTHFYRRRHRYVMRPNEETGKLEPKPSGYFYIDGRTLHELPAGSVLVQIEMTFRVYHPQGMEIIDPRQKTDYQGQARPDLFVDEDVQQTNTALATAAPDSFDINAAKAQNQEIAETIAGRRGRK